MALNPTISEDEMGVLRLCEQYGDGLDLSVPRIARRVKDAARGCRDKGYLSSPHPKHPLRGLSLTVLGKSLLAQDRETIHPHG